MSMPFSRINIGDMYCLGWPYRMEWLVTDKADGQIEITGMVGNKVVSVWKKPSDRLFCHTKRVLVGREEKP